MRRREPIDFVGENGMQRGLASVRACRRVRLITIRASIITFAILGVPYYTYSIMGPKTIFEVLRPPY